MQGHGTKIEVLLLDPNGPGIDSMMAYFRHSPTIDVLGDVKRTLLAIDAMKERGCEPGGIETRLMTAHPHLSMVIINPDSDDGKMFVEFIDYGRPIYKLPHLEMSRKKDGEWFDYFLSHYRRIWKESKIYDNNQSQPNK